MEHLRWRPSVNEREFIETALQSDLRVDGRHSFDFRKLRISFGRYIHLHTSPTLLPIPSTLPLRSSGYQDSSSAVASRLQFDLVAVAAWLCFAPARGEFGLASLIVVAGVNSREDGSSEVQLGETHVLGYVTAQLVQPYRDRPNEGTLAIFTEFSPMADPAFEPGRPGESAIELGRVIDRGLRSPNSCFSSISSKGFER